MAEKLISVDAAAQLLGVPISTLYQWVHYHKVPCIRISSRMLRFRESDLLSWLNTKAQDVACVATPPQQNKNHGKQRKRSGSNNYVDALVESVKKEVFE